MSQNTPKSFTCKRVIKTIDVKPIVTHQVIKSKNKVQIDDTYKQFFASLLKLKDKDVQRRILQAVNGQKITCSSCGNKIQTKEKVVPEKFSIATQTLLKDFEFLNRINSSPKTIDAKSSVDPECFILNKIQLRRGKRKLEPYAIKTEQNDKYPIRKNELNPHSYESESVSNKLKQSNFLAEQPLVETIPKISESMPPDEFYSFQCNEKITQFNEPYQSIVIRMEEEMRTAFVCNEEGLYTIHQATINGDIFKIRRLLVIFNFYKRDINITSTDGKNETPLHYAMSSIRNPRNNDIINLLIDRGAEVLAVNDDGDTVLHLAAETIRDYSIASKLISKISLDDLSKINDKGRTVLHIAASSKNRIFVKVILNFIDTKLNISSIGQEIQFNNLGEYFQALDLIHLNYIKSFINEDFVRPTINAAKVKILNEQDGRTGKTAVFLSLDNTDESVALMLMAHFADTRIPDFNNTTCSFYCTEILKNRRLAQVIYNADSMHKAVVAKTLKGPERPRSFGSSTHISFDEDNFENGSDIVTKVFS